MTKVTVLGAGNVGAETARRIVEKDLADVVLIDIVEGLAEGKALDMLQSAPVEGFRSSVVGTTDFSLMKGSDVVVVTAGLARKPGMTREDLVIKNGQIIRSLAEQIKKYAPNCIVVIVTNPLDVMAQVLFKATGFDSKRVIGMAGILDTSRFATFLSIALDVPASEIDAMVIGGHGDAMVPVLNQTKVRGQSVSDVMPKELLEKIIARTRDGGAEIVKLLKTGSAYYAPSSSAVQMVEAILKDSKKTYPCSVYLTGQYGLKDVFIGVPVMLGRNGVEGVLELKLTDEEQKVLNRSARVIQDTLKICEQ